MPLLFSYGTLQQADVQLATFGRLLQGQKDELPGYEPSLVEIDEQSQATVPGRTHHDNAVPSDRKDSRVSGTVYDVTADELAAADRFEAPAAYRRVSVTLASGKQAWVYVSSRG
jgi:gamma-glutamylcyclotransferase (GGCT)/AIG2-like uncharacterized protein YtfP